MSGFLVQPALPNRTRSTDTHQRLVPDAILDVRSTSPTKMKEVYFKTRAQWRKWLAHNHHREPGIWMVIYKKTTGKPGLAYDDIVEEALCYGWVDSLVKNLDSDRYARKLTPRQPGSKWSAANIRRVNKLIRQGLMTKAGLQKIAAARKARLFKPASPPQISHSVPVELEQALAGNTRARNYFEQLAWSHQKYFIGWIATAKKPETRSRRVKESVRLLEEGKKLGLK